MFASLCEIITVRNNEFTIGVVIRDKEFTNHSQIFLSYPTVMGYGQQRTVCQWALNTWLAHVSSFGIIGVAIKKSSNVGPQMLRNNYERYNMSDSMSSKNEA